MAKDVIFVGLMSGTSLDGASAAVVRFNGHPNAKAYTVDLLSSVTRPYTANERHRIEQAIHQGATAAEWCGLDFEMGEWLAEAALAAMAEAGVARTDITAIASHGQTVWHEPTRATWQIGEAAVIAERTGLDVISDFRVRDVAAKGQGAPLVPIADALLFPSDTEWRALQNLGGIANVTIVAPGGGTDGVHAFDTGPGVVVIDGVVRALRPDLRFDTDATLARAGHVITEVVEELARDAYYRTLPPKSTGRERYSANYIAEFIARCRAVRPTATDADLVATAVALTVRTIRDAYHQLIAEPVHDVLVSGGGARHPVLFESLVSALAPKSVRRFDDIYFDGDAKECVAFALLGYLHVQRQPGNIPTATGARGPRVLGKLTPR